MRGLNFGHLFRVGYMRVPYNHVCAVSCLAAALVLIPLSAKGTDFSQYADINLKSTVRVFVNQPGNDKISYGTGIIIGKDGTILTCAHVVEKSGKIDIMLGDGATNNFYKANVLKVDAKLDLAVLKVDNCPERLRPIPFSQGPTPLPGSPVATIGAPMKIFRTVTAGIISYAGNDQGIDILVFDAKIMPGSSGGPVFDEQGDLIGIATGEIGHDGHGLSRAVSLSEIERFVSNSPQRGFLGINTTPVNSGIAGPNLTEGLKVTKLSCQGELQEGDIIMTFNDYQATSHNDLIRMVRKCAPGDKVELGILRKGEFKLIHMIIKELQK